MWKWHNLEYSEKIFCTAMGKVCLGKNCEQPDIIDFMKKYIVSERYEEIMAHWFSCWADYKVVDSEPAETE